jgi:hypothetical protein
MNLMRRQLLFMLILGLILPGISTHAMESKLGTPLTGEYNNFLPTGKITRFAGEALYYDISFLWFENAASAKVSFFEEHGKYFSVLEASTKGFVGFFTAYRKHYYKTEFEVIDNGRRLRPKTFLIEEQRDKRDDLVLDVIVPKEIFKTKTGKITFWSSKHLIPIETTVKDYILLGDLHARFTRREGL